MTEDLREEMAADLLAKGNGTLTSRILHEEEKLGVWAWNTLQGWDIFSHRHSK